MASHVQVIQRFLGPPWSRLSDEYALPERYTVRVDDDQYECVVELDVSVVGGRPQCRELRASAREGGPPVTGEELRKLPVAGFLRHTAIYAALRYTVEGETVTLAPIKDSDVDAVYDSIRKRAPKRRGRDQERLKDVAEIYKGALARREPPTQTVAEDLAVAHSTAAKLVRAARDEGLLEATTKGRARG